MKKVQVVSGFILKIIAYTFMVLDHLGVFLEMYGVMPGGSIFRILGRITFPLIIFLVVQSVIYTKNFWMYFLRLALLALPIMIFQIIAGYAIDSSMQSLHSPIVDLMLAALITYLIRKKNWLSLLSILPIAYILLAVLVEISSPLFGFKITWFPFFLQPDYTIVSLLLTLFYIVAHEVAIFRAKKYFYPDVTNEKELMKTDEFRVENNFFSALAIVLAASILYVMTLIEIDGLHVFRLAILSYQSWMILAIIPLFLYNGKRGYNPKWFQIGGYLFYPVHIILLFVIFYLSFGYF